MGQMGLHLRLYAVMISTFAWGRDLCIRHVRAPKMCFALPLIMDSGCRSVSGPELCALPVFILALQSHWLSMARHRYPRLSW